MVTATMAAQIPASNPTRVPLQTGQIQPRTGSDVGGPFGLGQPIAAANAVANGNPGRGPARQLIQMPGPDAFGLSHATAQTEELDWTSLRRQMKDLGVRSFQHEELSPGKHRMVCQLLNQNGQALLVEGQGLTEREAVDNCLAKVRGSQTSR